MAAASSPSQAPPIIQPPLESTPVAAECRRILNAHRRHFLILSLFFLPISFFPLLFPTFHKTLTSAVQIIPLLISSLLVSTSYLIAIGSITNSVRHAFHYTAPLTLTSCIPSFFPLFATAFSAQFPVFGTFLLFRSLVHLSGLESVIPPGTILTTGFVILQLIWGLAYAVAVVESKWGFTAWKRSFDLLKVDPIKTGYWKLVFFNGAFMGMMVSSLSPLPYTPLPLLVLGPCLIIPVLVMALLTITMSFAVLYIMSLSFPVDGEIQNQVQAPLLVSVC